MLPLEKPNYLNLEWSEQNRLPVPRVRVPVEEALGVEFCQGVEGLEAIGYDGVWVGGLYLKAHYRFYRSCAYAVCSKLMTREQAEGVVAIHGGSVMEYAGNTYYVTAFRLGCQHPRITYEWREPHTRVFRCRECGYEATFDTL